MIREIFARMSDNNIEYLINSDNLYKICIFLSQTELNNLLDN